MRWLIRAAMALILALAVGLAGLMLLPQERIARIAADQLGAQTGRAVTLAAPLSLSFWPVLGIETGPVSIANADWAEAAPMLEARALSIAVDAAAALRGEVRIRRVLAQDPVLRLSRGRDGRANWDFSGAAAPAANAAPETAGGPAPLPVLERLELRGARLIYAEPDRTPLDLGGVDLVLAWPDPGGVADLSVAMGPSGARLKIAAQIADFAAFLNGAVARITAEISAPGGSLRFVGRASTSGAAAGRIEADAADSARLARAAGLGALHIPPGLGRSASLRADLTYTADGRLALRDLDLALDGNRMRGAADIDLSGKPRFTARLAAGALDLTGLGAGAESGAGAGPGAGTGSQAWSRDPIDASALGLADGSLTFAAQSVALPQTRLGAVQGTLRIDSARAVLEFARLEAFGGQITGQLVANNRSGLSVGGDLTARNLGTAMLLTDLAGFDRLSGPASGHLAFLGVGQDMAAIMASLSGKGGIEMGQGRIAGFDLDALMAGDKSARGTTVFDRLTAGFTIAGGVLRNDDLAMSLPNFRADGAGQIGLAARDADYLITPVALRPRGGAGLALPIRIRGPWSDLSIRPELDGILKEKADAKIEAVRAETEERLKQKLSEELETQITDEKTLKDAAKQRIEEKARGGLLRLLERN